MDADGDSTLMTDQLTADQVHAQVHDLRARSATVPEKIELGIAQRDAIEAEVRAAAGTDDIGPLTSYNGLEIVKSRRQDHVRLLGSGDKGEDVEIVPAEPSAPSGPDAPIEEPEQSGG